MMPGPVACSSHIYSTMVWMTHIIGCTMTGMKSSGCDPRPVGCTFGRCCRMSAMPSTASMLSKQASRQIHDSIEVQHSRGSEQRATQGGPSAEASLSPSREAAKHIALTAAFHVNILQGSQKRVRVLCIHSYTYISRPLHQACTCPATQSTPA